ncbi:DEKNAAC101238 [Brettanomyces naardenensis]|uniref:DEKNAAC101238 n=1 Tax=Brettanomyces naardenensis TaxID=13370 RepID=A0A448YHK9_BRENA|nr:DEKNAAC101238 [Brettanomyces naardenensis]
MSGDYRDREFDGYRRGGYNYRGGRGRGGYYGGRREDPYGRPYGSSQDQPRGAERSPYSGETSSRSENETRNGNGSGAGNESGGSELTIPQGPQGSRAVRGGRGGRGGYRYRGDDRRRDDREYEYERRYEGYSRDGRQQEGYSSRSQFSDRPGRGGFRQRPSYGSERDEAAIRNGSGIRNGNGTVKVPKETTSVREPPRETHWVTRLHLTGEMKNVMQSHFDELSRISDTLFEAQEKRFQAEMEVAKYNRLTTSENLRTQLAEEKLEALNLA